jgi:hypothetical protein
MSQVVACAEAAMPAIIKKAGKRANKALAIRFMVTHDRGFH